MFLLPIPFSIISLVGLFTIYPRDSAAFLIETGEDAEEVMKAATSVVDIKDMETKNLIRQ